MAANTDTKVDPEALKLEQLREKRSNYDRLKPVDPPTLPEVREVVADNVEGQGGKKLELVADGQATTLKLGKESIVLDADAVRGLFTAVQHRVNEL